MAPIAKGFALHSGVIPPKSNIVVMLEAAGGDEAIFLVKDLVDGAAELQRRRERYPTLESRYVNVGAGVVGRAGTLMWNWILAPMGLHRTDVFVVNTLSCFPGKTADNQFFYPTGAVRKRAEATCADLWLQPLLEWNPTVSVVAMHPSALSRDVVPLPVVLRAVEKAKKFAAAGERVLLLMGGKAAKHWMGYGENTTRWCGHFQAETAWTRGKRLERWSENRRLSVEKKVKVKRLVLREWVRNMLDMYSLGEDGLYHAPPNYLTGAQREELLGLCVVKVKKVKLKEAA